MAMSTFDTVHMTSYFLFTFCRKLYVYLVHFSRNSKLFVESRKFYSTCIWRCHWG